MENIFNAIRNFSNSETYPSSCGPFKIKYTRDLTTGYATGYGGEGGGEWREGQREKIIHTLWCRYDDSQQNKKAILPVSKSTQMITFFFENGGVATLRYFLLHLSTPIPHRYHSTSFTLFF